MAFWEQQETPYCVPDVSPAFFEIPGFPCPFLTLLKQLVEQCYVMQYFKQLK